jgi:hypothetical protein
MPVLNGKSIMILSFKDGYPLILSMRHRLLPCQSAIEEGFYVWYSQLSGFFWKILHPLHHSFVAQVSHNPGMNVDA